MENQDSKLMFRVLKFLASNVGRIVLTIFFGIIFFLIIYLTLKSENVFVISIAPFASAFFGWKALNKITPSLFVWMPLIGWLIYFFIKGILSMMIGVFVAPFWLGKKISFAIMDKVDSSIDKKIN